MAAPYSSPVLLRSRRSRPGRRLAYACALSGIVHAWLPLLFQGSPVSAPAKPVASQALHVVLDSERAATLPVVVQQPEFPGRQAAPPPGSVAGTDTPPVPATRDSESALPGLVDTAYYPPQQLDVFPSLALPLDLNFLVPANDASARLSFVVLINAQGNVDAATAMESAGPTSAVRAALLAARFTPALRNGRAVRSRVILEVVAAP